MEDERGTSMNTPKNKKESGAAGTHKAPKLVAARDTRNHKIRGLWKRGNKFYVQFRTPGAGFSTRRALKLKVGDVEIAPRNLDEAKEALRAFQTDLKAGKITKRTDSLTLAAAVKDYLELQKAQTDKEVARLKTLVNSGHLDLRWQKNVWKPAYLIQCVRILGGKLEEDKAGAAAAPKRRAKPRRPFLSWMDHIGPNVKLRDIKPEHVADYMDKLRKKGRSNSTMNMHLTVFRQFLRQQARRGRLSVEMLPTRNEQNVKPNPAKKEFLETWHVDRLCECAKRYLVHGEAMAQYIRLLALCGARKMEAYRLKWEHVDFEKGYLSIGRDGLAKSGQIRKVPFLPGSALCRHLHYMHGLKDPFSPWMFPTPRRKNSPNFGYWTCSSRAWDKLQKKASKPDPDYPEDFDQPEHIRTGWKRLETTTLHDMRHHFISRCVIANINYRTIAKWVGHEDGGKLIGEVYAHTTDDIDRREAAKLEVASMPAAPAVAAVAR